MNLRMELWLFPLIGNLRKLSMFLLLLLSTAKLLQSCPTLCDPIEGSPPGSAIPRNLLGISHWSGLLFPSPMDESEKWKWSCSVVSDSQRPHGLQPTRVLRPWDPPGKNTGVGCHFLLQCMKMESESEVAQSCPTPSDPMDCSLPGSSIHGIFQARVLESPLKQELVTVYLEDRV